MEDKSVFQFKKYIVKSIEFIGNEDYRFNEETELDIEFDHSIEVENNAMEVELSAFIFREANIQECPFKMSVCIKGYFELKTEDDVTKFKINAIAILFPYLRAIISSYTANANIYPIILPSININQYFLNKEIAKCNK